LDFERVGELTHVETIAAGRGIRDLARLRRLYGKGCWREMKSRARIRLRNGRIRVAELHWYEAHGIGKKEFKRKRDLDPIATIDRLTASAIVSFICPLMPASSYKRTLFTSHFRDRLWA